MASLRQRISFLRRVEGSYLWLLILKKLGKKQGRRRHGDRFFCIPFDAPGGIQLMRDGENWMVPILRALLPRVSGTFVDAGANVGQTLLQLRAVDEERPWIGFEPAPSACATIRALIEANQIRNTKLIEAGLSDRAESAVLYGVSGTDGSATMLADYHGPNHPHQSVQTKVQVLDGSTLTDGELGDQVALVKIDVEGMELEVVRGLSKVLERDRPVIICEILPAPEDGTPRVADQRARQQELQGVLRQLRYRLVQIGVHGKFVDVELLDNGPNRHAGNYVILPEERFDELRPLLHEVSWLR